MSRILLTDAVAVPDRAAIAARLAVAHSLADLLTADDLERQQLLSATPPKPAAVLLLVVNHREPAVVFTQRTTHLPDHAGQISFPGGRCDAEDCSAEETALREAREEIGLDPSRVQVLGRLPDYRTSTGYKVTPVVGWAEPPLEYHPDPHEVDDVFEVPLAFLLDPRNHRHESALHHGRMRKFWAMPYGERYIWGATAGMLVTFHRILAPAGAAPRAA
jgi:8-oxo-dGTP pyrophosphatase MutT (NUDIX family)